VSSFRKIHLPFSDHRYLDVARIGLRSLLRPFRDPLRDVDGP
jgi:hypothetical protein